MNRKPASGIYNPPPHNVVLNYKSILIIKILGQLIGLTCIRKGDIGGNGIYIKTVKGRRLTKGNYALAGV